MSGPPVTDSYSKTVKDEIAGDSFFGKYSRRENQNYHSASKNNSHILTLFMQNETKSHV